MAEQHLRVLHSPTEHVVKLCLTTQCASVISDPLVKSSIKP